MRSVIIAAAFLGAAVLAYLFIFRTAPITNYPSSGTDIIAFGDSLVFGTGATKGNDFVSLLSQRIGQPIVNVGHPGDTTADGLARLHDIDRYKPKVVLLLLGGNDYLRRVKSEETFANLGKIIDDLHKRGAIVLLLGIRGGVLRDNFDAEFKKLHTTYQTAYVSNVLDGLLGDQTLMSDNIHPNDLGYAKVADRVEPVLKQLLR